IYTNDVPSIDASDPADGYRWGKFEYAVGSTNVLSNDWPLFRYADVLMMKAEAVMRSGEVGAGQLVTQVRMREFPNHPDNATVTDKDGQQSRVYDYARRDAILTTYEEGDNILYRRFLYKLR